MPTRVLSWDKLDTTAVPQQNCWQNTAFEKFYTTISFSKILIIIITLTIWISFKWRKYYCTQISNWPRKETMLLLLHQQNTKKATDVHWLTLKNGTNKSCSIKFLMTKFLECIYKLISSISQLRKIGSKKKKERKQWMYYLIDFQ